MKMSMLNCNRCGKNDTMMVDAPRLDDPRQYCLDCYVTLFPPTWTDEYMPLQDEPDREVDPHDGNGWTIDDSSQR